MEHEIDWLFYSENTKLLSLPEVVICLAGLENICVAQNIKDQPYLKLAPVYCPEA